MECLRLLDAWLLWVGWLHSREEQIWRMVVGVDFQLVGDELTKLLDFVGEGFGGDLFIWE